MQVIPLAGLEGFLPIDPILKRKLSVEELNNIYQIAERYLREGANKDPLKDRSNLGCIFLAGGGGARLQEYMKKFGRRAKATCPNVTPLSGDTFCQQNLKLIEAAASYYGHGVILPTVIMISNETKDEMIAHVKALPGFDRIKRRIGFAMQQVIPLEESGSASLYLKSEDELAAGGAGHGDAFNYILKPEAKAKMLVWSDLTQDFTEEADVAGWYESFGVKDIHYLPTDSLGYPFADRLWLGEHLITADKGVEGSERRAHITLYMVEKRLTTEGLGNVLVGPDGEKLQIDYKDPRAQEIRDRCFWGNASMMLVNLESLRGAVSPDFIQESPKPGTKLQDGEIVSCQRVKYEWSALDTPMSRNSVVEFPHFLTPA